MWNSIIIIIIIIIITFFFHIQGTAKSDEMLCINIQYGVDVRKVSTTVLRSAINNTNDY